MGKRIKRRDFVTRTAFLAAGSIIPAACARSMDREVEEGRDVAADERTKENRIAENRAMPRDLVYRQLDQKVDQYMQVSFNCAQSSYLALEEQLGLRGGQVLKALTPLTGIAERGETCGAVIGPLMVFGLIHGRDRNRLDDWEAYRNSLVPSGEFCRRFEKEYGSTMCHDIQTGEFGRCYDLTDPRQLREFQEADATAHCSSVVRKAVRIAADVILDDTNEVR